jgi:V/A-type H+-transporting ATPase subunit B
MKRVYSRIFNIAGNVIAVRARDVHYEELAEISTSYGKSLAQVIRLSGDEVSLQVFAGSRGISTGDEVRFLGHPMRISFSENLLGRIFNGGGVPLDNGPALTENLVDIGGPSVNPSMRIVPRSMIRTGIPMIDVFNSLVESQKLPMFSVPGEPYNELLARIALQAEVDIIILGGIGLKYDEFIKFRETLDEGGALSRSIFFMHTASDPVVESLMVPDMALTVAERFALRGKRVLVLLTDMTNFADALKEISITMEQVPSNRGYPGDLYTQLAKRYEKAVDFEGAGSITVLAVVTMPGDDITHPVPDNTGYITEGQFYLRNGRIDPFGSLSRLRQLVNRDTREDHRALMDTMIHLYAAFKDTEEKRSMGFRMSTWDEKLIRYGRLFESRIMDLSVNVPLERALDLGWQTLADCFQPEETGLRTDLIQRFWFHAGGKGTA